MACTHCQRRQERLRRAAPVALALLVLAAFCAGWALRGPQAPDLINPTPAQQAPEPTLDDLSAEAFGEEH